jgi:hypothetical protein
VWSCLMPAEAVTRECKCMVVHVLMVLIYSLTTTASA